jgi:hypothetical protein
MPQTGQVTSMPAKVPRADALAELARRIEPGQHAVLIAPTGRGKSTLMAELIPATSFDRVVMLCPKGSDPAYAKLGHPTTLWPPRKRWQDTLKELFALEEDRHAERPQVWRVEVDIRSDADELLQARIFGDVLTATRRRRQGQPDSLLVLLDDSQLISELNEYTKKLVNQLMLITRAKRASLINMYQGPTFVPRRALDQPEHVLIWRNRDRDTARRLAEIADIDHAEMLGIMLSLGFYEALWIDGRRGEMWIIGQ